MEQRFVVVSETAPKLKELDADSAREFLREYDSYENRVEGSETIVPMRRCLERDILDLLLALTEGELFLVPEAAGPPEPVRNADAAAQPPNIGDIDEVNDNEVNEDAASGASSADTVPDRLAPGVFVRLSNEHVVAMLTSELGPVDENNAGMIFEKLTMVKQSVPYANMVEAMKYLRDWKIAEQWCAHHRPKEKFLIKQFIKGIYPKKLRSVLDMHGFKKLKSVRDRFLQEYKVLVRARRALSCTGGLDDEAYSASASSSGTKDGARKPASTEVAKKKTKETTFSASDKTRGSSSDGGKTAVAEKTCYNCHQVGHIRPNCYLTLRSIYPRNRPS